MTAVFMAMLLAVSSSIAAFVANGVSGTEAIVQFGIGAAAALAWAYLILGQIAPRITVWLEEYVGPNPIKGWSKPAYALGAVVMAVVGGLMVAAGALMPIAGVVLLAVFLSTVIWIPAVLTRRRNRRAINRGKDFQPRTGGVGHGLAPVGRLVGGLARWRVVTVPVVLIVAVLGLTQAMQVESGFEIKDFISSKTDFAQSIERTSAHFPSTGEGSSIVYIEGDLTDPMTLARISGLVDDLDSSGAQFGRNADGEVLVGFHAGDVVSMVMASPAAADLGLVDADRNGLPDSSSGIERALRYAWANGVPSPDGSVAIAALDVPGIVAETDTGLATAVVIQVGSYTDGAIIEPVRQAMEVAAASFENDTTDTTAIVTGEVIVSYLSMEAFTKSMLVSVPLAALLTFLIAAAMLRSVRYALVSVIPIGLVVMGIYSFMSIANFRVNVVSATIAAIAVGVGIDFSTHFTVRYREELAVDGSRLDAVRRAGAGTGGALVLSAVTSVLGFTVMALAPMPIFATFGILTAVMIILSLAVALLVLPSLLVLVTKDRVESPESPEAREAVLVG
jgi:predicted RND superfamily exporter protein